MVELHEINVKLSKYQKEKICQAFLNREKILLRLTNDALRGSDTLLVPSKSLKMTEDDTILDKSTFIERLENGTLFVNSTADERMENYRLLFYPTLVERLESKRKNEYKGMEIFLDYSLITDSTKEAVTRNIEKLTECGGLAAIELIRKL